ncbi:hypothetical protein RSP816_15455 (plasmid) [Ralstonia solanacearum]|nr:hypothetical protein CDC59_19565 [Ralstonia solanacearum]RCW08148.1 hypothetical protein RSP816_15455 [Ralstonia solanacearum]
MPPRRSRRSTVSSPASRPWSRCWYAAPGDRNPYLNRSGSPGYLFGYSDACSVALAQAFAEIARMAGAKFAVSESMDV